MCSVHLYQVIIDKCFKDPVFRKNTGFAWALLGDTQNVQRALQFMNDAQVTKYCCKVVQNFS